MNISRLIKIRYRKCYNRLINYFLGLSEHSSWAIRDHMLSDQWWAAFKDNNSEECDRLRVLMKENFEQYTDKIK